MRSLREWFEYVEKQAKELEKKKKEQEEEKVSPQAKQAPQTEEKKEEPPKARGIVFDSIYVGGKGTEGAGKGITFVNLPENLKIEEKALKSYKRAKKETREEFLQRLLDPVLTLQEVARLLNVCPMTVRRYTNKGILPSFRTAGNQRRFRLSDVLRFIEEREARKGGEEK
ncbi:helix-turn-helix domain-containing protein [bacterium]|nr:helix-turn-helix domain-containing protein [bacterium]